MFTLIAFIIIFFLTYIALCVPADEFSVLGKLKKKLTSFFSIFYYLLPESLRGVVYDLYDYVINKPNPIVQIIYLCLVSGLFLVYYVYGIKEFFPHRVISNIYVKLIYVFTCLSLYSFYLVCTVQPGIITKNNYQLIKERYPIPSLFSGNNKKECKKCEFQIIPRSKHCYICDKCIEKFDHHCIWVNQCIGANNYKYFMMFLLFHFILTGFAGGVGIAVFYYYIVDKNLFHVTFYSRETHQKVESSYLIVMKYVIGRNYAFFATLVMLIVISITLLVFTCYHLNLVRLCYTNAERNKQMRTISTLHQIREILVKVAKQKGFKFSDRELTDEEIAKYKHIIFEEPECDLGKLTEEELNKFYNFTIQGIIIFRKNPYKITFIKSFINMLNGR